jgi:phage tail-like protein
MSTAGLRKGTNATFRFIVEIGGAAQAAFTECSVPVIEWEIEEIKEGGLNTFTHQLPGHRKGARLTLKNGVGSTALYDWCVQTMSESFERKKVTVTLLDSMKAKVMSWDLIGAYPIKWTGPQLNASDNSVAIQTLELACGEVTVST